MGYMPSKCHSTECASVLQIQFVHVFNLTQDSKVSISFESFSSITQPITKK